MGFFYGPQYVVYADKNNKIFVMSQGLSPADISFFTIDPATNNVIDSAKSPYHGDYSMSMLLYLSETQDLLFTSSGNIFKTSNLRYASARQQKPARGHAQMGFVFALRTPLPGLH